jgi:hypothetical protein
MRQVADATAVLHERDGYTAALAVFLEQDVSASKQESEMKVELRSLEAQISDLQARLEACKALQNPAHAAYRVKEKGFYVIEIQRYQASIHLSREGAQQAKRQIACCVVHPRYRTGIALAAQTQKLLRKQKRLRAILGSTHKEFQKLKPERPLADDNSKKEREASRMAIDDHMKLLRAKERKDVRAEKHRTHLEGLLRQIEELNSSLGDIGLEQQIVDVDGLRREMNPTEEEEISWDSDSDQDQPDETFQTKSTPLATKRRKVYQDSRSKQ